MDRLGDVQVAQSRHVAREASSSRMGGVPSSTARAAIAAEAGPVLMPHGP
jgi:hypothetical protein